MLKRRCQVEGGILKGRGRHCCSEHEAVGQRRSELEVPGLSRRQETASPARRISGWYRRSCLDWRHLVLFVGLPDRVDRPGRGEVARRGLQAERDVCGLFRWNYSTVLRLQRGRLPHGRSDIEGPFETRRPPGTVISHMGRSRRGSRRSRRLLDETTRCGGCSRRYSCAA